jgi:hypothetical protein
LEQEQTLAITKQLQEHHPSSLQHIFLQCTLSAATILQFAQVISNNHQLVTLGIGSPINRTKNDDNNDTNNHNSPSSTAITAATAIVQQDQEAALLEVAQALESSPNLQSFTLRLVHLNTTTKQAFCDMLETNYVLQSLQLQPVDDNQHQHQQQQQHSDNCCCCPILQHMEFLLLLNRSGRQQLLQYSEHATTNQWMQVLGRESHHLDFVYYFLRRNPSLCSGVVLDITTTTTTTFPWKSITKKCGERQKRKRGCW